MASGTASRRHARAEGVHDGMKPMTHDGLYDRSYLDMQALLHCFPLLLFLVLGRRSGWVVRLDCGVVYGNMWPTVCV